MYDFFVGYEKRTARLQTRGCLADYFFLFVGIIKPSTDKDRGLLLFTRNLQTDIYLRLTLKRFVGYPKAYFQHLANLDASI